MEQTEDSQNTHTRKISALVVHCKVKPFDVYVGRGQGSEWGNPFTHLQVQATAAQFQVATREAAVQKHKEWFLSQPEMVAKAKRELKGKILGCWCAPKSCHAEILAAVAND